MSNTMTLIGILAILVFCSSFFSATETAYSSINKIKLKNMASAGSRKAQKALELADGYDRLLSTILVGNNVVNILASSLATVLFVQNLGFGDAGVSLSTAVMTIVILILRRNFTEKHREGNAGEVCDGGCGRDWFYPDALNSDQLSVQFVEEAAFDDV